MPTTERTYGQYCPIAAGLDVVGDRWTLLICRELALGDRRYTDLRNALDGIAPNLSERPPARAPRRRPRHHVSSFRLLRPATSTGSPTKAGRVVPVLRAVARFGVALPRRRARRKR